MAYKMNTKPNSYLNTTWSYLSREAAAHFSSSISLSPVTLTAELPFPVDSAPYPARLWGGDRFAVGTLRWRLPAVRASFVLIALGQWWPRGLNNYQIHCFIFMHLFCLCYFLVSYYCAFLFWVGFVPTTNDVF